MDRFEQFVARVDARFTHFGDEMGALQGEVREIKGDLGEMKTHLSQMQTHLSQMQTHTTRMDHSLTTIRATITDLQGDFREFPGIMKSALGGFVTTQTSQGERLDALEKRVDDLEGRLPD